MTKEASIGRMGISGIKSLLMLAVTVFFGIALSGEAAEYVRDGFELAVRCVIPSSLPFMVISDFYVTYGHPENIRLLRLVFTRFFGMPEECLAPFICGNIGGFPIGAKMTADLYSAGVISRDTAERLAPLSNNPSCAFIIGGVGLGIYGDAGIGFLLLASVYTATLLCGILSKMKSENNLFSNINIKQNYNFVNSIKQAGISSISIISFISVFSVAMGIIKKRVKNALLIYLISSVAEVTNAIKIFSEADALPHHFALCLSAFSLGFGGVCVGLQSSVFTSCAGLKMRKYYALKLIEGIISAAVFSLLFFIYNSTK